MLRAFSGLHLFYVMIIFNITEIFKRLNKALLLLLLLFLLLLLLLLLLNSIVFPPLHFMNLSFSRGLEESRWRALFDEKRVVQLRKIQTLLNHSIWRPKKNRDRVTSPVCLILSSLLCLRDNSILRHYLRH